ncbi:unnamed protein product [Ilex paraguariensis]|uniref:Uncharacterized protein n=1 Tax=Ilex paraguariensis TaxID=185542 RepID=A0ABC8RSS2_9AQUA
MADSGGEEEETETPIQVLLKWQRINYPHRHSQTQYDLPNGWSSMMAIRDSAHTHDQTSLIFPPIDHENLHISKHSSHPIPNTKSTSSSYPFDQKNSCNSSSYSSSPFDLDRDDPPLLVPSPPRKRAGDVARWLRLGLQLLRCHITDITSTIRKFVNTRGVRWSFLSPVLVAAAMLFTVLYLRLRRRRLLQVSRESIGDLIHIIKQQDEKLNQLSHQIAQANEVLLALHRVLDSKTG